ncbi:MAG TPA: hypothetical protein VHW02_02455 [Rhizomicrobium sp.]|jgi:hypothetical protein|nr:hypothetical protein [Rhizomicrobium sp.]
MPATTVLTDDATVISEDTAERSRFSWPAAFAGAFAATAVTFLLVTLGAGVGLSLTSTPALLSGSAPTFLTLGAVYFLAAQAFGFAVGGYVVGRLIGPAIETSKEEEFRSGTHGFVTWALAVVATATMLAISGLALTGAASNAGATMAASASADGTKLTSLTTGYWVDMLFRGASESRQATVADRAEAGRILNVGLANGGKLAGDDHDRLATLVSRDTGVSRDDASTRVDEVQSRIRNSEMQAAETARKVTRNAALWAAFALLFGAIVSIFAAIAARHEDDRVTFGLPARGRM